MIGHSEAGQTRLDYYDAVGGEEYYLNVTSLSEAIDLRLANLAELHDGALTVHGTSGDDSFEFDASASRMVTVNGIRYHFEDSELSSVSFDGGDGVDVVILRDSAGDDTLTVEPGLASFSNVAAGFSVAMAGFEELHAYAKAGGNDTAVLKDSPGNDKFKGDPTVAKMYKRGLFFHRVKFFDTVHGLSDAGGNDTARLWDSPGDDTLLSQRDETRLYRDGEFDITVGGFHDVSVQATNGGFDTADLIDSPLDDTVRARSHKVMIWAGDYEAPIYKRTVRKFDDVSLHATEGGFDKFKMHDTARDDVLEVTRDWVQLSTQKDELDVLYRAMAFEWVKAYSSAGHDTVQKPDVVDFTHLEMDGPWEE